MVKVTFHLPRSIDGNMFFDSITQIEELPAVPREGEAVYIEPLLNPSGIRGSQIVCRVHSVNWYTSSNSVYVVLRRV